LTLFACSSRDSFRRRDGFDDTERLEAGPLRDERDHPAGWRLEREEADLVFGNVDRLVEADARSTLRQLLGGRARPTFARCSLLSAAALLLRARHPLLAFSLAWFLLTLAPALSLNTVGENFFAERYLYIPSLGFSVIAAWAFLCLLRKLGSTAAKALLAAIVAVVFIFYATQIERRIPVFHDNFSLYSVTVLESPNAAVVQGGLASAYYERGDLDHALEYGFKAVALNPAFEIARINLAGIEPLYSRMALEATVVPWRISSRAAGAMPVSSSIWPRPSTMARA
jgi:tetratricopeptide (TPR) repeat protein